MKLVICFPRKVSEQDVENVNNVLATYGFSKMSNGKKEKEVSTFYQAKGGLVSGDLIGALYALGVINVRI